MYFFASYIYTDRKFGTVSGECTGVGCGGRLGVGFVGADDSVGPLGSCGFAGDFRDNGAFCRADRGVRPYREMRGVRSSLVRDSI